jgi:hypothetical protein
MSAATMTHQSWLWPVKLVLEVLEGAVVSDVGTSDLSHIPISISRME